MRRILLLSILHTVMILMVSGTVCAETTALDDEVLEDITGKAGFAKGVVTLTIDRHIDTMTVMNGLFTLGDVTVQGSVVIDSSSDPDPADQMTDLDLSEYGIIGFGLEVIQSIGLSSGQVDATINMNMISIDAVYAGEDTNGPSFGSVGVSGLSTHINGTAVITSH